MVAVRVVVGEQFFRPVAEDAAGQGIHENVRFGVDEWVGGPGGGRRERGLTGFLGQVFRYHADNVPGISLIISQNRKFRKGVLVTVS
ncbi:hypothetical protein Atai01_17910 [Amycolatopsis taiwanensis]|uniref:Uncharacterized protein n=1 Tax=Amycolatopsis taiwanensis TaxID=342230 RepID=A0A9W6R072_9PSEU|nr:hypothetical protein Atai01_17910 [Amycolatopsis taiwanensis]